MSQPPPLTVEHRCRASVVEKETRWAIQGNLLVKSVEGMPDYQIPLESLREIRLQFAPTRYQTKRYVCHLHDSRGKCAAFQSGHYVGFANFADRGDSFRKLVLTLISRRFAIGGSCRYIGGTSMINWLFQSAIFIGSLCMLAAAFYFFWSAVGWMALFKLALIAWLVPVAWNWVRRNRPRDFDPENIPEGLLPDPP